MATTGRDWLAQQMERRGISVRQIADAMEVTTQTVYGWQSGKTVINEERIPRLAEALGVTLIEARRGLGFWVPEGDTPAAPSQDLEAVERLLKQAIEELARLKDEREIS